MKTEKHYEEFVSANILGVELEHNGFQGGDAGHGGFVRIKFTDLASTYMELNREEVDEFEILFRGDTERETLTQALKMLYDKLKTTAVIIVALLSLTIGGIGQFRETPPPAIYLAYQPIDHGLGIRGDYHLNHWAGVYGSGSYGQWGLYKGSGLDQHVKLTAGILIPYKDWRGNQYNWSVGLNHHWVSGQVVESEVFKDDPVFHQPWSFEVGLTIKMRRFALGMRTDILRWEPCIDVGIPLDFRRNGYGHRRR